MTLLPKQCVVCLREVYIVSGHAGFAGLQGLRICYGECFNKFKDALRPTLCRVAQETVIAASATGQIREDAQFVLAVLDHEEGGMEEKFYHARDFIERLAFNTQFASEDSAATLPKGGDA